jgi:hypothetical protein
VLEHERWRSPRACNAFAAWLGRADHQLVEALAGGVGGWERGQDAAATHDRHSFGKPNHLIELVGDEDDGLAAADQLTQCDEERLDLGWRKVGGRFVEHDHLGAVVQQLHQLHALASAERQAPDRLVSIDREAVAGRQARREPAEITLQRQPSGKAMAKRDVLGSGEARHQALFLVDHADAQPLGVFGRVDLDRPPIELDLASIGSVQPGQDIHQAGLAGAVFAEERVDLAALCFECGGVDGHDIAEAFLNAAHRENDRHCSSPEVTAT